MNNALRIGLISFLACCSSAKAATTDYPTTEEADARTRQHMEDAKKKEDETKKKQAALEWSPELAIVLGLGLLAFGVSVVVLVSHLIKQGQEPELMLRTFGTLLIIVMAAFLVVVGYSDKQMAPVMGLMGTVVGYLLGKTFSKTEKLPKKPHEHVEPSPPINSADQPPA